MLIISINSKSYINPQNSDDIVSEEEAESWRNFAANDVHKLTFTKICQELGVPSDTHKRFKRLVFLKRNFIKIIFDRTGFFPQNELSGFFGTYQSDGDGSSVFVLKTKGQSKISEINLFS